MYLRDGHLLANILCQNIGEPWSAVREIIDWNFLFEKKNEVNSGGNCLNLRESQCVSNEQAIIALPLEFLTTNTPETRSINLTHCVNAQTIKGLLVV